MSGPSIYLSPVDPPGVWGRKRLESKHMEFRVSRGNYETCLYHVRLSTGEYNTTRGISYMTSYMLRCEFPLNVA